MSRRADKLEKKAIADEKLGEIHQARVRFENGAFKAVCRCMWKGPVRETMAEAQADAVGHQSQR